jgi:hypothetical protein
MNSTAQFIKVPWRLLLCLAALIALALCALLFLTSRRASFHVFVSSTNKVRGVQTMQVVVTNILNASSIQPVTEVMRDDRWVQVSTQRFEINTRESEWLTVRRLQVEEEFSWVDFPTDLWVSPNARLIFRFPIPTESGRWRLKLVCPRPFFEMGKENFKVVREAGLRVPFQHAFRVHLRIRQIGFHELSVESIDETQRRKDAEARSKILFSVSLR